MNMCLWVAQSILAFIFLGSGIAKSVMSREKMQATGQTGAASQPLPLIRFVAFCEILGALGMILPFAFGIHQALTPLAAAGFAIIMIGAIRIHSRLRERGAMVTNLVLMLLSLFVVVGRWPR